ncbi:unnamed protein product, partial [Onchocerca ochengi]|uniref:Cystatin domain-containing protein n=1 Tax=Onchocerca ochengi TaxID=42157 RepID=A0A182F0K6_ONCOC
QYRYIVKTVFKYKNYNYEKITVKNHINGNH